jgi:hypothetical protein
MVTKKKEKLPGFSSGVRANSAVRMVKLARPICPKSKLKMVKDDEGKWTPAEEQAVNCQLSDEPRWWKQCESLGHEPFFTTRVWYEKQDKLEEIEPGVFEVTGQKRIRHTAKYPNIAQVAQTIRVNSAKGVQFKMERHGFKRLADLGYEEVCQFRNCQKPLSDAGKGGIYGNYCSLEHLSLIAADDQGMLLHYPVQSLNREEYPKVQRERAKQLREAAAIARQ